MIAFSTGALYTYDVERAFALAKEAGFEGVEVLVDHRWDTRQPDRLNRLSERYGLPITSVHSPFVPGIVDWPASDADRCVQAVALAEAVGARTVVVHLPARFSGIEIRWPAVRQKPFYIRYPYTWDKKHLRWLKDGLLDLQAKTSVTIALENLPYRRAFFGLWQTPWHMNTPQDWAQFPHWTMDTTHLGTGGFDILAVYEQLKGKLAHVHLSNFNGKEHRLLTDGRLPLAELLQRLQRDGYQGAIVCELDPEPLNAGDEKVVRANLRATYEFCRQHFGPTTAQHEEPN